MSKEEDLKGAMDELLVSSMQKMSLESRVRILNEANNMSIKITTLFFLFLYEDHKDCDETCVVDPTKHFEDFIEEHTEKIRASVMMTLAANGYEFPKGINEELRKEIEAMIREEENGDKKH